MDGISMSGTDSFLVQLGDAGGFETTGYSALSGLYDGSSAAIGAPTTGFVLPANNATNLYSGVLTLNRVSGNTWFCHSLFHRLAPNAVGQITGTKTLSETLTSIRLISAGSNTFDAGSASISWEF
jgi:hypothetical protein